MGVWVYSRALMAPSNEIPCRGTIKRYLFVPFVTSICQGTFMDTSTVCTSYQVTVPSGHWFGSFTLKSFSFPCLTPLIWFFPTTLYLVPLSPPPPAIRPKIPWGQGSHLYFSFFPQCLVWYVAEFLVHTNGWMVMHFDIILYTTFVIPARIKKDSMSVVPLPGTMAASIPYIRSHHLWWQFENEAKTIVNETAIAWVHQRSKEQNGGRSNSWTWNRSTKSFCT